MNTNSPLTIGIIGAGFSGTALAVNIHHLNKQQRPVEILLFEKRGCLAKGEAYSTPYDYHLLNVRAGEMSAFENKPTDFVDWLKATPVAAPYIAGDQPIERQFMPRMLYGKYLESLLANCTVIVYESAVIGAELAGEQVILRLADGTKKQVDKAVLAIGNILPTSLPFHMADPSACLSPWDFTAPSQFKKDAAVLIIGTGLSMIDCILTLHRHGHHGPITALSRHGLVPLRHTDLHLSAVELPELPTEMRPLLSLLRDFIQAHEEQAGDWRNVVHALRLRLIELWQSMPQLEKRRFLRHVLPYWNIHRHRVHDDIADVLDALIRNQQLTILAARIIRVNLHDAEIRLRHHSGTKTIPCDYVINCMGPAASLKSINDPLLKNLFDQGLATLDELAMHLALSGIGELQSAQGLYSTQLYAIGPLTKGRYWAVNSVPEIRQQCEDLAGVLLG